MRIITHPGAAHADDLFAAAMAGIARFWEGVERRDPTAAELEDPDVWVLDVGGRLDPAHRCWDHHQDRASPCAAHLLLDSLAEGEVDSLQGPEWWAQVRQGLQMQAWWQALSDLDTRGPYQLARGLGIDHTHLIAGGALASPWIAGLRRWFAADPMAALEAAIEIVAPLLDEARALVVELEVGREVTTRHEVGGLVVLVTDGRPPPLVTRRLVEEVGEVAVVCAHDDRGPGWSILRWEDHPAVDLSALGDDERVEFAHAGGFVAKTKQRLSVAELLGLVAAGMRP